MDGDGQSWRARRIEPWQCPPIFNAAVHPTDRVAHNLPLRPEPGSVLNY